METIKIPVRLLQKDFFEYQESRRRQRQSECKHRFERIPLLDNEHDRVLEVCVCRKCGFES